MKPIEFYLAVCCLKALRKVSGWNNSDKSSVVLVSNSPVDAFSSHDPSASALATSDLKYCGGSLGPSHAFTHDDGICIVKWEL